MVRGVESSFHHPSTLTETNMTPENRPSQKESNLPTIHFQGLVSFMEGIQSQKMSKNATATKWGFRRFNGQTKTRGNCVWKGVKRGIQEATRYLLHERQWFNQESKKTDYPKREDDTFFEHVKTPNTWVERCKRSFPCGICKNSLLSACGKAAHSWFADLLPKNIIFSTHLEPGNSWRPSKYFISYLEDPFSKWCVTPSKQAMNRPFGKGITITPARGPILTMIRNHLPNGMSLQAGKMAGKPLGWRGPSWEKNPAGAFWMGIGTQ